LSDARVDVLGYACLVAIMSMGKGYHCQSESRLQQVTAREGAPAPVVTSAGALVHGLRTLRARRIAMVAPYVQSLCNMVADYIEHEGFEVADRIALEIPDNLEVGRRDPMALVDIYKKLKLDGVDVLVLSSCVQMPSLAAIPIVEQECGLPVISASVCTTYQMLEKLGLKTYAPDAGALLSGSH
jgi:maleate isomerase